MYQIARFVTVLNKSCVLPMVPVNLYHIILHLQVLVCVEVLHSVHTKNKSILYIHKNCIMSCATIKLNFTTIATFIQVMQLLPQWFT